MNMIRRRDDDGVDVLVLGVQHPTEISILSGARVALERIGGSSLVDVAQSDDVLAADRIEIAGPSAANADAGYVELFARRNMTTSAKNVARGNRKRRRSCRCSYEPTARQLCAARDACLLSISHENTPCTKIKYQKANIKIKEVIRRRRIPQFCILIFAFYISSDQPSR
jgi:hypothetical protein